MQHSKTRKSKVGRVVSDSMEKTVVVRVEMVRQHPLYRRIVTSSRKFMAHDEQGMAHTGDLVRIVETRPLSKNKCWRVAEVLKQGLRLD